MKISLTGVSATGFHGVLDAERRDGQLFVADVTLRVPVPVGDDIGDTIDYAAVAALVASLIAGEPCKLIETLAARIADAVLSRWPVVRRVTVTVHKPDAPVAVAFSDISCTLSRRRSGGSPVQFVLSFGSNIGDAQTILAQAVDVLKHEPEIAVSAVSDVYRTAPVEVPDDTQPDYFNLVVTGQTTLDPFALLRATAAIEAHFGRTRPYHHAPRTLDIDLIDVGNAVISSNTLVLPHPRAFARGFVLVPWAQIAPNDTLPNGRVGDLASVFDGSAICRIGPLP